VHHQRGVSKGAIGSPERPPHDSCVCVEGGGGDFRPCAGVVGMKEVGHVAVCACCRLVKATWPRTHAQNRTANPHGNPAENRKIARKTHTKKQQWQTKTMNTCLDARNKELLERVLDWLLREATRVGELQSCFGCASSANLKNLKYYIRRRHRRRF
jgi:hypothetical protein